MRVGGDGEWLPLGMPELTVNRRSVILQIPANLLSTAKSHSGNNSMELRYLWADWPVPTIYDARKQEQENDQLPAPPFVESVRVRARDVP